MLSGKIGIGTVQFGQHYGISNKVGQTTLSEITEILNLADRLGVRVIDTAALYGQSEKILGMVLNPGTEFRIVTKTVQFGKSQIGSGDAEKMITEFEHSLIKLNQNSVYGLLIHNVDDLLAPGGGFLFDKLQELKQRKKVLKIGASVYNSNQIDLILKRFKIDLIQLPINIFDQRLMKSGHLKSLKDSGIEIHARSAFLQGLLFMQTKELSGFFDPIKQHIKNFQDYVSDLNITPLDAALGYLNKLKEIDIIVCGINNCSQFMEIFSAITLGDNFDYERFAVTDEIYLNPANWKV